MRSNNEQRIGWKDPDGRHLRDGECLCRPHDEVDATGETKSESTIDPEHDDHCPFKPEADSSCPNGILGDVGKDCSETDNGSWCEEGFCWMHYAGLEGTRIEVKSQRYHGNVEDKKDDVENEEKAAKGIQSLKPPWHWRTLGTVEIWLCDTDTHTIH